MYQILNMAMNRQNGLLLSDSMFRDIPRDSRDQLISTFNLKNLEIHGFGGYKSEQLIGPNGEFHKLVKMYKSDILIISCGQNDFNEGIALQPDSISAEQVAKAVSTKISSLLCSLATQYNGLKAIFLPLSGRKICSQNTRHAQSKNEMWIQKVNDGIQCFTAIFKVCECHADRLFQCQSQAPNMWSDVLKKDGIHLNDNGKRMAIKMTCTQFSAEWYAQNQQHIP